MRDDLLIFVMGLNCRSSRCLFFGMVRVLNCRNFLCVSSGVVVNTMFATILNPEVFFASTTQSKCQGQACTSPIQVQFRLPLGDIPSFDEKIM